MTKSHPFESEPFFSCICVNYDSNENVKKLMTSSFEYILRQIINNKHLSHVKAVKKSRNNIIIPLK